MFDATVIRSGDLRPNDILLVAGHLAVVVNTLTLGDWIALTVKVQNSQISSTIIFHENLYVERVMSTE